MSDRDRLEGALMTLVRVGLDELERVTRDFQDWDLHNDAGMHHTPDADLIREYLEYDDLHLFDLIPEDSDEPAAYAGIAVFSGPPFVFIHYIKGIEPDLDTAQEAIQLLAGAFFEVTEEEQLWTYQAKPVPDEIHDRLIEGGFDLWDTTVPGINNERTACYVLERHTFDAYYSDEAEEDFEL